MNVVYMKTVPGAAPVRDFAECVKRLTACRTCNYQSKGIAGSTYFADRLRDPLPVTEEIAPCLVGLPIAPDLSEPQIEHVIAALAAALRNPG
jgi:dTDP-4-amino-4,6-dideoxygalactose transaminase